VDPRAVLDAAVKRKIPSARRESNPRTPIIQPVSQRYTAEVSRLLFAAVDVLILFHTQNMEACL
jgi:hypothetical protein